MSNVDIGLGLIQGLQRGIGAYYNQKQAIQDKDAEMASRGLIRQGDQWVDDPAYVAKQRQKMIMEGRMKNLPEGMDFDFDEAGNLVTKGMNPEYVKFKKEMAKLAAEANPLTALTAQIKRRELSQPNLTPGETEADKAFGKDYQEYTAQGGSAGVEKSIKSAEEAVNRLGAFDANGKFVPGKVQTGGFSGKVAPKWVRDIFDPNLSAVQEDLESSVQDTMKTTLGGQFTEREGANVLKRTFNPALGNEINVRRAQMVIQRLKKMGEAKKMAAQYWEKFGTLKGFQGSALLDPSTLTADLPGDKATAKGQGVGSGLLNAIQPQSGADTVSSEDQQAIQWARQNRGNPDAEQILQLHGIK